MHMVFGRKFNIANARADYAREFARMQVARQRENAAIATGSDFDQAVSHASLAEGGFYWSKNYTKLTDVEVDAIFHSLTKTPAELAEEFGRVKKELQDIFDEDYLS